MKIIKNFLLFISALSLSLGASAVDTSFPNDKVTMWGDYSGITLDVKLIGGAPYDPLYQEMIPVWEEKTGGKVKILSKKSHFELDKEIKVDIAAGNISYCVVSNHTSFATQYGDIYRDLNGIVPGDYLAEFVPLVLDHSTVEGRLVQLPQHSDVSNLWYIKSIYEDADNKNQFKAEYGYDLAPPETLDQWKEQAIFWSDPPNFYGTQYVGKEEAITGRFYELVIAEGGALFDDGWHPTFNDAAGQSALQWFVDLYDAKAVPAGVLNYLWDETGLGFASGTVALNLDWGGWGAYFNSADSKIGGDVGLVRFPLGSGGKRGGWSGSHTYSILNGCPEENLDAAASLIWILTNHEAQMHGCSIAYTRPSVVFGFGRQNTAINWAEDFAAKPALGEPAHLPFSKKNTDNWIYVDDCAEQLVRLALKDKLNFASYNSGSQTVTGEELEKTVKKFLPNAEINFDEKNLRTPLIDDQDDSRIRKEIDFNPRSFADGVKCLIEEVQESKKLKGM